MTQFQKCLNEHEWLNYTFLDSNCRICYHCITIQVFKDGEWKDLEKEIHAHAAFLRVVRDFIPLESLPGGIT